jgi:hypothetical protein
VVLWDPELAVHQDKPQGIPHLTYAHFDGKTVTVLAIAVVGEPLKGMPCFELGVAVPEAYRKQGRAKKIVEAAIAELKHGLARNKISTFYVEAVVGFENEASKRVASAIISATAVAGQTTYRGFPRTSTFERSDRAAP